MDKDAILIMRFPSPVKDALKRAAEADGRTMSGLALRILSTWLQEQGHLPQVPAAKRSKKGR